MAPIVSTVVLVENNETLLRFQVVKVILVVDINSDKSTLLYNATKKTDSRGQDLVGTS